jgi:hypothetical protein
VRIDLLPPPSSPRAKPWSIELRGAVAVTQVGTAVREKSFPNAWEAERHLERELRKKLLAGFYAYEPEPPGHGGVVFLVGFRFGTSCFDLHPDGRSALVGQVRADAHAVEIVHVDFATGTRSTVWSVESHYHSSLHAVRFERGGGSAIFALNENTHRIDLATREVTQLAGYRSMSMLDRPGVFNPYCVKPTCDASRDRWLMFDGDEVQVRAADASVLFRRDGRHPTCSIWRVTLSPSGRRVAVHIASRFIIFSHDDARADTTNVIEVWDVDSGGLLCMLDPGAHRLPNEMAISPDDGHLLMTVWCGPPGVSVLDLANPSREPTPLSLPEPQGHTFDMAFSPDRALLVLGGMNRVFIITWPSNVPLLDAPERARRVERVCLSDDGRLVATGGASGEISVRSVPR